MFTGVAFLVYSEGLLPDAILEFLYRMRIFLSFSRKIKEYISSTAHRCVETGCQIVKRKSAVATQRGQTTKEAR